MSEFNLPEEWVRTQLGDAIDYGKCEKAEPSSIDDDMWVLELEDVEKDTSKVIQFLTFADRQSKSTKNKFNRGAVLYGKLRPYLNKVVMANNDGVCTTEIIPLNGGQFVNNKFIFYWLKTADFLTYVTAVGYGVNMPRLGTEDGKAAPFVFAPLAEQQQIAQKLDELLAQVDTLKTRLDAIPKILKRFRQSVLAAAVSGRLTDCNSEVLKIPLGDVFEIFSGFAFKKSDYSESGSRLLQIANVGYAKVIWDDQNFIPQELADSEYENFRLREGDIVLAMNRPITNETLKVAKIHSKDLPATLYQRVSCLRIKSGFSASYAYLAMQSPIFLKLVELNLQGSDQPYLNSSTLPKLEIRAPNYEDQVAVVRRVEQLFAYADQIEQRVKDAQARVNHLTQSILAKAFRGELTTEWRAQNPDLISGENSAVALLERIKAEREVAGKVKKKKA